MFFFFFTSHRLQYVYRLWNKMLSSTCLCKIYELNGGCWQPVSPCFPHFFPNCMAVSDSKSWCHLPGNNFPNVVNLNKKNKSRPNSLLCSLCMMATALSSCTFPSHCLLLSFLFASPSFCSFSPPSGSALPGHSSRRVHFERINTVPIKGQRAARRSTRKHHSLSRTLLRYGRKPLTWCKC